MTRLLVVVSRTVLEGELSPDPVDLVDIQHCDVVVPPRADTAGAVHPAFGAQDLGPNHMGFGPIRGRVHALTNHPCRPAWSDVADMSEVDERGAVLEVIHRDDLQRAHTAEHAGRLTTELGGAR